MRINELAKHNYIGQELIAPFLVQKEIESKPKYVPATIKPGWKIPDSPFGQVCPECNIKSNQSLTIPETDGFSDGNAHLDDVNRFFLKMACHLRFGLSLKIRQTGEIFKMLDLLFSNYH